MAIRNFLRSPAAIVTAGFLALAVAMGIGRFAFTPLLPLMNQEGKLTVAQGGWLADANYVGYLLGALFAARLRLRPPALVAGGLAAIALSTMAMALPGMAAWVVLRFAAGLCSAAVFVAASIWNLQALNDLGRPDLVGRVYAGVGAGIALSGLHALGAAAAGLASEALWLQLGIAAAVCSAYVCAVLCAAVPGHAGASAPPRPARAGAPSDSRGTAGMILSYGIMGFGYILPATFLPVMARSVVDDPRVFGLAWPVFGAMALLSTLAAGAWIRRWTRLKVWAWSQAIMGLGVALPGLWLSRWTVLSSALLVGGTLMVITLAGIQEIRERSGPRAVAGVGYMTAAFAAGQIAGPVLSALLLGSLPHPEKALQISFLVAAAALAASAAWLRSRAIPVTAGASSGVRYR